MLKTDDTWQGLIGGNRPKKLLLSSLRNDRISHNYLLEGPVGIGKFPFALKFARSLICTKPANGLACGKCDDCRLFDHGRHPDVLIFNRSDGLVVDEARLINDLLMLSPLRSDRKVIVLDGVDRANTQASNALLKTLEDTTGKNVFILITHRPEKLLPTILSRSLRVPFTLLSPTELSDAFKSYFGLDDQSANHAAELSGGRPGWGIRFLLHPEFGELYAHGKEIIREGLFNLPLGRIFHKESLIVKFLDECSRIFSEQDNVAGMDAVMLRKVLDGEKVDFHPVNLFVEPKKSDEKPQKKSGSKSKKTGSIGIDASETEEKSGKRSGSKLRHLDALGFVLLGGIFSGMVSRGEIDDFTRHHRLMEAFIEAPRQIEKYHNRDLVVERFILTAHGRFGV
jgi:DNA polymerase III delta' subunit